MANDKKKHILGLSIKTCTMLFVLTLYCIVPSSALLNEGVGHSNKIVLNDDWEFKFGDGDWKKIDIPHDFSIFQKFDEDCEGESGFLPGGKAVYKKTFVLKSETPFSAILYFDGVYKESYVSVNGKQVGENHYGYNPFWFDVSELLNLDGKTENVIEVKVEHELPSSRWYSGSGMLRGVYLRVTNLVHLEHHGVKVTTPDIASGKGTVNVVSGVVNKDGSDAKVKLNIKINRNGKTVKETQTEEQEISKGAIKQIEAKLNVESPELWSDTTPTLYELVVELVAGDTVLDTYNTKLGFRYFSFDQKNGFIVNGKPAKMHGVSIHHDYGALGSIDNYDAAIKRFTQLKEMGINAIRTTHNTPYRTWIDICDELGFYVIEEIFDGWNYNKNWNSNDISKYFLTKIENDNNVIGGKGLTWGQFILQSSLKRDRNSPSIVMWSIGNEVSCNSKLDENTHNVAKDLIYHGKMIDDTRPFTRGDNEYWSSDKNQISVNEEIQQSGGVVGYNYAGHDPLRWGAQKYGAIYLSESASAVNSRSVYTTMENGGLKQVHDGAYHLTSYDTSYCSWSTTAHYSLWTTLSQDYVSGQFVWTGFDYIGEPTPWNGMGGGSQTKKGPIPNSSYFGVIDTAGFPKDSYYMYRSQLRRDSTTLHIVSAWDKRNILIDGNKTPVHIYSNAPKFEVFRDDKEDPICTSTRRVIKTTFGHEFYIYDVKSNDYICEEVQPSDKDQGTDLFSRYKIEFKEGTKLYTKAYDESGSLIDASKIVGNHFIKAPNTQKLKLVVHVDKKSLKADGRSLAYVEVSINDDEGIVDTKANNLITFTLEGEGRILGVDNGDQATVDKFQQASVLKGDGNANIRAYAGKALAIFSSTKKEGSIKFTIESEGFESVEVEIETKK